MSVVALVWEPKVGLLLIPCSLNPLLLLPLDALLLDPRQKIWCAVRLLLHLESPLLLGRKSLERRLTSLVLDANRGRLPVG